MNGGVFVDLHGWSSRLSGQAYRMGPCFTGKRRKRRDIKVSANAETSALTSEVLARHFTLLEVFPNPFYWFLMIVPLLLLFVFRRFDGYASFYS